jgi:chromosome segregation ATPase
LQSAGHLLGSGWPEFVGNPEAPFIFAMNDAVEIVDRATACAQALALTLTHRHDQACEAELEKIGRTSLRAALRQCESDLVVARDDALALRADFRRVCKELDAEGAQKVGLEQTAKARLARIHELEAQLERTQEAFADANKSAYERLDEIMALEARIRRTDAALDEARSLAVQRLQERTTLSARLDQVLRSLEETRGLAVHRLDLVHGLELRLRDTDAALEQVKAQSVQRLHDNMRLEERIRQTDAALDEVKQLAVARLARIEALEQDLNEVRFAAAGPDAITAPHAVRCPDADASRCLALTPDPEL